MDKAKLTRISYWLIAFVIFMVGWLKLATPFLTILFSILALNIFKFAKRKWLAVIIFSVVVTTIFYGFYFLIQESIRTLPKIVEASIPVANKYAQQYGIDIGITDAEALKIRAARELAQELEGVANFAKIATKEFVLIIIGLVVAISIFMNSKFDLATDHYAIKNNVYTILGEEISARFRSLYESFRTVMGAQMIISCINTAFTGIFVHIVDLPYANLVVVITFLCGLLPIVGNILSNTLITCIALTVSPNMALFALAFLIILHKGEYFLNSKIIGGKIKNPMWLTLLGLLAGESIMGVAGLILAPVILHFVKHEAAKVEVRNW